MKRERKTAKQGTAAGAVSNSQNFITDARLLERIVRISGIGREDTVVEIGTGKGHLAQALCGKCGFLYSVEIDGALYEKAGKRLAGVRNLKLIHGDFLKWRLPARGRYTVFANIPYFITTQIMDKLTDAPNPPKDMWLVMEKGAAKRFMGIPAQSKKSLFLKPFWDMEIVYYFRRSDFHPAPSVDSVLLHVSRRSGPDLKKEEEAAYRKFIEHSLRCGIGRKGGFLTKKQAATALKLAKLPPLPASGETLYIQWLCLFRCYEQFAGGGKTRR